MRALANEESVCKLASADPPTTTDVKQFDENNWVESVNEQRENTESLQDERSQLELLAERYVELDRQGQAPDIEDFVVQNPELESEIRELFPVMLMLDQGGRTRSDLPPTTLGSGVGPGKEIGDYELLRPIGRGGMGIVYEALNRNLGHRVAIKLLPTSMDRPKLRERFMREASAAARMNHPNIVRVFEYGNALGHHYYVMSLIEGIGLNLVIARIGTDSESDRRPSTLAMRPAEVSTSRAPKSEPASPENAGKDSTVPDSSTQPVGSTPLSFDMSKTAKSAGYKDDVRPSDVSTVRPSNRWEWSAGIALQAADALAYAHRMGVIHRDIKPGNLLLDEQDTLYVTDFGLVKLADDSSITETGDLLGTLRYLPPEAIQGNFDERGDVYGLGLTIYELLSGQPAFSEQEHGKLLHAIAMGDFIPLEKLVPRVPKDLAQIVRKATDADLSLRYASAKELHEDLNHFLAGEPVSARPASLAYRATRWVSRNRGISALAGTLFAVLTFATAGAVINANHFRTLASEKTRINAELVVAIEAEKTAKLEALENAKAAREQNELALEMINKTVFNVQQSLRAFPATARVRRTLLRAALDDVQRVSRYSEESADISKSRSQALLELGGIYMSIGDDPELGTALKQGYELVDRAVTMRRTLHTESPEDESLLRDYCFALAALGEAEDRIGRTSIASDVHQELMRLSTRLAEISSSNENLAVLAQAHLKMGDSHKRLGSVALALEEYEKATSLRSRLLESMALASPAELDESVAPERQAARELADTYNRKGIALDRLGRLAEAQQAYNHAIELVSSASGESNMIDGRQRAKYLINLGRVILQSSDPKRAFESFESAHQIRLDLSAVDPANAQLQTDLANSHTGLGTAHLKMLEMKPALEHYRQAWQLSEALVQASPDSRDSQQLLSQSLSNLAGLYFGMGVLDEALKHHSSSKQISEKLLEGDPRNVNLVFDVGIAWLNIGMNHQLLGDTPESIEAYKKAIDVLRRLHKLDPNDAHNLRLLLESYWKLANVHMMEEDQPSLLESLREGIRIADAVLTQRPNDEETQATKARFEGYAFFYRDEFSAAADAAHRFASAAPENPDAWYNAACLVALCASAAEAPKSRAKFQKQAMELLTQSVANGFWDFDNMQHDEDLKAIRTMPEFQLLLNPDQSEPASK